MPDPSDGRRRPTGRSEAVRMVARTQLRSRWSTVLAVGLLLGVVGGLGIACLAGARRTSSVVGRHVVASDAPDIEIDPGSLSPEADKAIRSLPGVTDASYWVTIAAYKLGPDHRIIRSLADGLSFTTDGRYLRTDRVAVSQGRRLDPDRADEVMANESWAQAAGVKVGSRFEMGLVPVDDEGNPVSDKPARVVPVRLVGIMVLNEEITSESIDITPRLFVSPALKVEPKGRPDYYGFSWYGLRLAGGKSAVAGVEQRWTEVAAAHNKVAVSDNRPGYQFGEGSWLTYFHRTADLERKAARSVRPLTTTLVVFGALALLMAIVLGTQALARTIRTSQAELRIARIVGLTPGQAVCAALAVPVAALTVALAVAAVTAVSGSGLFPVGPYKVLEPHPGLALDLPVLASGLAALLIVPLGLLSVGAYRVMRRHGIVAPDTPSRASRFAAMANRRSPSPSVAAAVRLTVEPGQGRAYVPTRSTLVSVSMTIAVLVTVLVFGTNLSSLNHEPARFGWPSDGLLASDGGYSPFDQPKITTWLGKNHDVTHWRLVSAGQASVAGQSVPAAIFGPGYERFVPTMLSGHAPAGQGEVVLGASTARAIGAEVGDKVMVGTGSRRRQALITGTAVFPVLGPVLAVRTGLDLGAWFDVSDYAQLDNIVAMTDEYGAPPQPYYSLVMVDLRPGSSVAGLQRAVTGSGVGTGSSVDAMGVIRPSEVRTATAAGAGTQLLLCGLLALAAGLSVLLTLATVVRRRRSELALYRILGFTPSQVRTTLLLQGFLVAATAVVFGVTIGIGTGRILWRVFATHLGVFPGPTQPAMALVLAVVATLMVGIVSSIGPGIAASRVSPAVGIRAE